MNSKYGQYFKLSKLTNVMMECGQTGYYLSKFQNRIGIVHEGNEYYYLTYLEDNVFIFDTSFQYLTEDEKEYEIQYDNDSENENNSNLQANQSRSSVHIQKLLYSFCGKVLYFFLCQQLGQILRIELKTENEKIFQIKMDYLEEMCSQKTTNFIILLYSQHTFEIRNTQTFDLINQIELTLFPSIVDMNLFNSIIIFEFDEGMLHFFQIRPNKVHQLFILNGNSCKIYSKLLVLRKHLQKFQFYYNISKPKLIRQVQLQTKNQSTYKFIEKDNQIFLKEKSQNFVRLSFYKWWVGTFKKSSLIKQLFEGQITSREAKEKVYILELKAISLDSIENEKNIQSFSSPYSIVYDRYA
ncbi:unnamed protein product [Paramecium sonneborni]|uniref:Uncharacterized protein n=1 Tax=Paramecium sonneborni TaxID=65129 RepID=A0A8S1PIK2_9CILI|nr:unnamed protein product [Paramecium sonneborni]